MTSQEFLPELESATSEQDNPFDLQITFCPAPKVTANVVCHTTLQFVQSSHKASQRSAGASEVSSMPAVRCLPATTQGKQTHHASKLRVASRTNKLQEYAQLRAHCAPVLKSCKLLPVCEGWISSLAVEKKYFPSTIQASKMLKIMVYIHPLPEAYILFPQT